MVAGLQRKYLHLTDATFSYYDRPATASKSNKNAETIVFLHGFTSNKTMWMLLAKYLPKKWRIVVIDMPGHGESSFKTSENYSTDGMVEKIHEVRNYAAFMINIYAWVIRLESFPAITSPYSFPKGQEELTLASLSNL